MREAVEAHVEKESDRVKAGWVRDAWFSSCIIMAITGKRIDPMDLLPDWISGKKPLTKEEKDRQLKELKKELKVKD